MEEKNMSEITKIVLPSGKVRYEFTVEIGNKLKRKTKRKRAKTMKEAKELQARYLLDKSEGLTEGVKFKQITAEWLAYTKNSLEESTYMNRESEVRLHFDPYLGDYDVDKINRTLLEDYIAFTSNPKNGKAPAKDTIASRIGLLKIIFNRAILAGYIKINPASKLRAPKHLKEGALIAYEDEQVKKLLDAMKNTRYYLPAVLGFNLGLRIGEIAGLKFQHIDFENGKITIAEQYSRKLRKQKFNLKTTKSATVISVEPKIIALIKERFELTQIEKQRPDGNYTDNDYICAGTTGKPLNYNTFNNVLKKICEENDLPVITSHCMRSTLSTRLGEGEDAVSPIEYSIVMRHSLKVAMAHYIKVHKNRKLLPETVAKLRNKTIL
jgi:integrase